MKAIPFFVNRRLPLFERMRQTEHTYQWGIGFDWYFVRDGGTTVRRFFI